GDWHVNGTLPTIARFWLTLANQEGCGWVAPASRPAVALVVAGVVGYVVVHVADSMRLTDAQFKGEHFRRITSPDWRRRFRPAAIKHYGDRCAVCGLEYEKRGFNRWQLIVDHKRYWKDGKLIFGRETMDDVRVLCPDHNRKGVQSDFAISEWRK